MVLRSNGFADHKNKNKKICQRRRDGNGKEREGGHTLNVTTNGQNKKALFTIHPVLQLNFKVNVPVARCS